MVPLRLRKMRDTLRVMSFNGIAHLSQPERHHAITYA